jgi:hypothetical protein
MKMDITAEWLIGLIQWGCFLIEKERSGIGLYSPNVT